MKTRKQKVICILACVFLLASFFCMPVSALDYENRVFAFPYWIEGETNYISVAGLTSNLTQLNGGPYWNYYNPSSSSSSSGTSRFIWSWPDAFPSNTGYVSIILGISDFGQDGYTTSDTVWVDPLSLTLTSGTDDQIVNYRFSLRQVTSMSDNGITSTIGYSNFVGVGITASSKTINVPQTFIPIKQGRNVSALALCLDMQVRSNNTDVELEVDLKESTISCNYAVGNSPNIPQYPSADQGNLGNLESNENQLMQDNQAGLDETSNIFNNFASTLGDFSLGFGRVSVILSRLTGRVPLLSIIVTISLSLGLFASLLGLAGALVGAADRKAGREAAREARINKSRK